MHFADGLGRAGSGEWWSLGGSPLDLLEQDVHQAVGLGAQVEGRGGEQWRHDVQSGASRQAQGVLPVQLAGQVAARAQQGVVVDEASKLVEAAGAQRLDDGSAQAAAARRAHDARLGEVDTAGHGPPEALVLANALFASAQRAQRMLRVRGYMVREKRHVVRRVLDPERLGSEAAEEAGDGLYLHGDGDDGDDNDAGPRSPTTLDRLLEVAGGVCGPGKTRCDLVLI